MTIYIALLRGINVGGNKKVSMAELKKLVAEIGLESPQTLLQSGNLVFKSSEKSATKLETMLCDLLDERLDMKIHVFVRTLAEWKEIVAHNPYDAEAKSDPSHLVVIAFAEAPNPATLKTVQDAMTGPERFTAVGREMFVVYPEGIGTSTVGKTPGWNKLTGVGTARNWNTVLKLAELAGTL